MMLCAMLSRKIIMLLATRDVSIRLMHSQWTLTGHQCPAAGGEPVSPAWRWPWLHKSPHTGVSWPYEHPETPADMCVTMHQLLRRCSSGPRVGHPHHHRAPTRARCGGRSHGTDGCPDSSATHRYIAMCCPLGHWRRSGRGRSACPRDRAPKMALDAIVTA